MFYIWFICEESQSSNVIFLIKYTAVEKKEWQLKTYMMNAKKQFAMWKNGTCVTINALHNEKLSKLCQQDYAIWNTALKKKCSNDPVIQYM